MEKIKVLIVDDSAFMRKLISDLLAENPRIEVISTARNGEEAVKKVKELKPDVVTLDVEMPVMNGLEALKAIMSENPVPIVMLSSTTVEGAENTFLAMQYGAVDFIAKPSGAISLDLHKVKGELIEKVLAASKANLKSIKSFSLKSNSRLPESKPYSKIESKEVEMVYSKSTTIKSSLASGHKRIVVIGTSTGGPRALQHVLTKIPAHIQAPILVVQHMPPGFTKSLANRLNSLSYITVKEAEDGDILQKGTAYVAPGGFHMKIHRVGTALAIKLDQTPPLNGHRPSVDVMFSSVSEIADYSKVAVVMTGMGSDGAQGLIDLKNSGNVKAIAESQETSIVFGMPKAAIATRLVDDVQNVDKIADSIMKYL